MSDLYETDVALWAERQAAALRRRAGNEIDWENVAEEIESLSRTDKREIRSRLAIICADLLKWRFQPDARSNSWRSSIDQSRDEIADIIKESPSLAAYPPLQLGDAYGRGRRAAARETGIADLPTLCPWTATEVLDPDFWPEAGQENAA
jgi:hypothetical protein